MLVQHDQSIRQGREAGMQRALLGQRLSQLFTPDAEVAQNAAKAKYTDDVLELTLAKTPGTASKQIAVSQAMGTMGCRRRGTRHDRKEKL